MLVAICYDIGSFFDGAKQLLNWIGQLDNYHDRHQLVLIATARVSVDDARELDALAKPRFSQVISIKQNVSQSGWPRAANSLFRTANEYVTQRRIPYFLWVEVDCAPLKPGWLDAIEAAYLKCGKPFMGTIYEHPTPHLNGVMVYPGNIAKYNAGILAADSFPMDYVRPELTLQHGFNSPLFQRMLADPHKNLPMTFPTQASLSVIRPEAVLFHGDKSGTLIERLREKLFDGQPAPESKLKQLRDKWLPKVSRKAAVFVELGRAGDIINMLPVAQKYAEKHGKPYLMVSKPFAPLLDGVSYVKPYPVDLVPTQLTEAMELATKSFSKVIRTQINGRGHNQAKLCPSWPQESWREAGVLEHYHDKSWRLEFDRRDSGREQLLINKLFRTDKPKLVTNLTSAVSAPFPEGPRLLSHIQKEFSQYEVIDIGQVRCERLYDLIGVYEKAAAVISIDTATSHLAAAVDVPLIALVNPAGWLGPVPRYNCVARIPYNQANPKTVGDAIRSVPAWTEQQNLINMLARPPKLRENRLKLPMITLWGCCWSDSKEYLMRTLRVLRYCHTIVEWNKIMMFSYQPVPKLGFPCELIQIPQLTAENYGIFHIHTLPHMLPETYCLSIHEDGFVLDPQMWSDEFLSYDFLGAPWNDGVVGNSGFALESSRFLKAKAALPFNERLSIPISTQLGPQHMIPSDVFVCRTHRKLLEEQGMKFAPKEVAARFSTEQTDKDKPSLGFHGKHDSPSKLARAWTMVEASERY